MSSTFQHPIPVREYLSTELATNCIVELEGEDVALAIISRFGLIPKRGQEGQWRLIQDLSYPSGQSINKVLCSLVYDTVDMAIQQITKLGHWLKLIYNMPIAMYQSTHRTKLLVGMQFEGGVFLDTTLPFGLRSAPKILAAVTDALEWMLKDNGVKWIMHYLDNYLTIGSPGSDECLHNMAVMTECCSRLGVLEEGEGIKALQHASSSWVSC